MKILNISNTEYVVSDVEVRDLFHQRFCVFDFEATGANPEEDSITQMGAVIIDKKKIKEGEYFNALVKSTKPIPKEIERLTGIKNSDIQTAAKLANVYGKFIHFTNDTIMVAQAGYEYDWPLLEYECQRNGMPMLSNTILDTKMLFTYLYPHITEVISTNFLINFFLINDNDIKRHEALGDSILIARVFMKILEEFQRRKINDLIIKEPLVIKRMKLTPIL